MTRLTPLIGVLVGIAAAAMGPGSAWSGEIVIGLQCDRTGPTAFRARSMTIGKVVMKIAPKIEPITEPRPPIMTIAR